MSTVTPFTWVGVPRILTCRQIIRRPDSVESGDQSRAANSPRALMFSGNLVAPEKKSKSTRMPVQRARVDSGSSFIHRFDLDPAYPADMNEATFPRTAISQIFIAVPGSNQEWEGGWGLGGGGWGAWGGGSSFLIEYRPAARPPVSSRRLESQSGLHSAGDTQTGHSRLGIGRTGHV